MINHRLLLAIVNVVTTVVEGLLAMRILLKFLAARNAPFVNWVYETTQPLLHPFAGMFPSPQIGSGVTLEFSAIFAVVVYAFIGYLATEFIEMISDNNERLNHRGK